MKKRYLLLLLIYNFVFSQNAGFFGSNVGSLVVYDLNGNGNVNSWNWNQNIGTANSLILKGGINHTWKNSNGNICSGRLYYRVYKDGDTPGSFSSQINMSFSANHSFTTNAVPSNVISGGSGDQRWQVNNQNINLLSNINSSGTYVLELYFQATGSGSSNSSCGDTFTNNNGGNNFRLFFNVNVQYRSKNTGDWEDSTKWEKSFDGTNWVDASIAPPTKEENVTILSNHSIEISSNALSKNLNLQSNADLIIKSGYNLTIKENLTNNGSFTIENNANLIQEGTANNNSGNITVNRDSASLLRLDYTLWSSPVANQNLLDFSPQTITNRFYVYNPSSNVYNSVTPSITDFTPGTGYLIRMPDNHPTTATVWNGTFSGLPHNGTVTVSVANDTYNAVGNPYPSTIDADDFINENSLTEALYFWRKTNGASGSAYATYTLAGGTANGSSEEPSGIIQVGQGFIARSTSTSLVFNNSMRVGNNDNQFFRLANTEHNRVRLAINGNNGLYQEVLINYMTGATNELDPAIDGKYINDSETAFYTLLNNEAYVIQGRALPFDNNDVVPLGFKTTQAGTYQISLIQNDGLFASEEQNIFVRDMDLNVIHDFANGNYSFTSETGVFDERFELLFNNETLSINQPNLNSTDVLVYNSDGVLNIESVQNTLKKVTLYDINGRILLQQSLNSNNSQIPLQGFARQMLLVTIETQNGIITKKIIH